MQENLKIVIDTFENKIPANKLLGLKVLKLEEGFVKIHIPYKEEFIGDFWQKRWHGGIQAAITDSAAGIVAFANMRDLSSSVNTIDMRIDYLHGSEPKDFFAEAKIIKIGKRILIVDIELYHEKTKTIAIARCSLSDLSKNK